MTGGLSLPAQATIAGLALAGEAVLFIRLQLQLIANIARITETPLNPDDPEDVLLIFGFALGGIGADIVGSTGAKVAGHLAKTAVRQQIRGKTLEALKGAARVLGLKVLQRTIIKYAVPLVSMVVGGGWNYVTTQKIGRIAAQHFRETSKKRAHTPKVPARRRKKAASARRSKPPATNDARVLSLNLHRESFDTIAAGTKTTEYREYKPYWMRRLDGREYDEIHFRNGYATSAPFMRVECRGIKVEGRGATKRYAIALGCVLEIKGQHAKR